MSRYYYWITEGLGTGYVDADSADDAAREVASKLAGKYPGETVNARSDDHSETAECTIE